MSTKRKANQQINSENVSAPKKMAFNDGDTENNNDINKTEQIQKNDAAAAAIIKSVDSDKLADDILKRHYVEPGKLLIAGNVAWKVHGSEVRNKGLTREELYIFHRFTDQKYRAIYSGPSASHSILINMDYKVLSFGRNQNGQCGHHKLTVFNEPKLIKQLKSVNIVQAACGTKHSLFLSDAGVVYACGENKNGKLGIGKKSIDSVTEPTRINYNGAPIVKVGCGAEFSVILDINGHLYTFGLPEYGQLGHNTDGKFFITANRLAFHIEYSPQCVQHFVEQSKEGRKIPISNVKIIDFACGKNHTIAIDAEKRAFSFGFGGYGRLGHNEQKDEWMPRLIKYLNARVTGGAIRAYCGSTFSLVISGHNNPYLFGKNKNTAGAQALMYPKVVDALCGPNIKSIGCSGTSIVVACDNDKLIAWGAAPTYGELGIGDSPKSSSEPMYVESMNDVKVSQVAMGMEHTLLLVNTDADNKTTNEKYLAQPEYHPTKEAN